MIGMGTTNSHKELDQRQGQLVDHLPAVTFEYAFFPDGRRDFLYISPRSQAMFGLTPAEIVKGDIPMQDYIHADDWPEFQVSIIEKAKNLSDRKDWRWEGRVKTPKGYIWIEATASGEFLPDGTVTWVGIINDISLRKSTEQKQRDTEQRLELALHGANLGLWDYNYQTNGTVFNDRCREILQFDDPDNDPRNLYYEDYIHPEDIGSYQATMIAHRLGQTESFSSSYRFRMKDGSWRWVLEKGRIVERTSSGEPLRSVGILQDFEETRAKEQLIQESEERYRQLVDHLPLGVTIVQEGVVQYINSFGASLLGAENPQAIAGQLFLDFVSPSHRATTLDRRSHVLRGEQTSSIEQHFIRLDGHVIDVDVIDIPFRFAGKPAIQTIFRDVTAQRQAEIARRKSETLFTQLFHVSPLAIVVLNEQGKVQQVNEGFEKMFGYATEELMGKALNEFIVPGELETEGNDLNTLISSQQVVRLETKRMHRSGRPLSVIIYGMPIMVDQVAIGIFGVYVDITEQKKIEEELKTRNAELDNFVYKVSHDLRAPLSSIRGLVNLAKLPGNTDDPAEYLNVIGQKVSQLDHFITDVLSHSKNLKLDIRIEPIDFKKMIDQTFTDLNYLAGADEIIRSLTISGGAFYSDRWRIAEIFRNLISNAIKYRNFRRADPEIIIRIDITPSAAHIEFRDNGIGISEENLAKIFNMFFRASEQSDGSGLGLYIVKNAIDKLNGKVVVDSVYGEGTSFIIDLPNRPAEPAS